jgi:VCBS repeat protein
MGVLVLNKPGGFVEAKDCGISYRTGRVGPTFIDLNNDGRPDLFVPQDGVCKLFRNDGQAHFTDITATTGDLAKPIGQAVCAAWGDFQNNGQLDLFVGCLRGPNRYFRNRGDGTFVDMSQEIGLTQKRFNTQAIALVDLNNDGMLDVVFVNEGQESCLMFGNPAFVSSARNRTSVTVQIGKALSAVGGTATVKGADGKTISMQRVSGGDGRGGQCVNTPRFALWPGKYQLEVRDSKGEVRAKELVVTQQHMKVVIE